MERDERPIIAMDFAVRKARANDGGVDDDLVTFLAIVDSSTGRMRAIASETKGATDSFASSVTDFEKNLFVGKFRLRCDNEPSIMAVAEKVKVKMPDKVVVENRDTAQRATASQNEQVGQSANT